MNIQSKRPLITVLVIFLSLGVLGAIGFSVGRAMKAMSPGQMRVVKLAEFEPIGGYQMVKIGDGDWFRSYSPHASPEECGSEPTVESMPYGTEFTMLIVPSRDVTPREKLKETFTKDGKEIAWVLIEGADIMGGKTSTCFVDHGLLTTTATTAADDKFQKWPGGLLPTGRYHFELTSGTEVLSAGDFTITAP